MKLRSKAACAESVMMRGRGLATPAPFIAIRGTCHPQRASPRKPALVLYSAGIGLESIARGTLPTGATLRVTETGTLTHLGWVAGQFLVSIGGAGLESITNNGTDR